MLTRGDRNLKLNVILRNGGSGLEHLPFFCQERFGVQNNVACDHVKQRGVVAGICD